MRPYVNRRTNHNPWHWHVAAARHYHQGPVPDGELTRSSDLSEDHALEIRQSQLYHPDTKRAALRRIWLA